ncbi:hypothetical protein HG536_0A05370 [Torulaspora globosa]|uniref:Pre-mRNA-splicing factor SYF1 n=1 Tax=Torulaspora globosa TaxID=48254 RepID=A0A7G3ZB36_9SACH|nr:uncharacterized protein HG536_0A05370 [Torulaspora globosa]QLL30722.1 hypothetical protein HG536_0A05370 [Torulaspora globosa]
MNRLNCTQMLSQHFKIPVWCQMEWLDQYIVREDDLAYEYELQRTPQSVVTWGRYLEDWKSQPRSERPLKHVIWLYERFCAEFNDSIDVWKEYIRWLAGKCGEEVHYRFVIDLFLRCLRNFSKDCDELCLMFLEFAIEQADLEAIRIAFDMSLERVPRDSHGRVWDKMLRFIDERLAPLTEEDESVYENEEEELSVLIYKSLFGPSTAAEDESKVDLWSSSIVRRYLEVCPRDKLPDALGRLARTGDYESLFASFHKALNSNDGCLPDKTLPRETNLQYLRALDCLNKGPNYEAFATEMARVFPEMEIKMTTMLAKFYVKNGGHEKVVQLLEDSLAKVATVQDFHVLYETYLNYEKSYIQTVLQELQTKTEPVCEKKWKGQLDNHMDRLQNLVETYELRLNDLKIRQNPNLVANWSERAALVRTNVDKCSIYSQAILTIDPFKVNVPGSFGKLWCDYANLYWKARDYESAREVYDRGLRVPYPYIEDLENIWSSWVENEMEEAGLEVALKLLETALRVPENPELLLAEFNEGDRKVPAQGVIFSSLKLWQLYLDFTESLCAQTSEAVEKMVNLYEQAIALKVATPKMFVDYAHFLQDRGEKLASFQVYERAIGLFPPETQFQFWNLYLAESTAEENLLAKEHIREIFEQALEILIPSGIDCKAIFILYSDFEERCGLSNRCVEILLEGCRKTADLEDKVTLWQICLLKVKELLGNEESRRFYEECIQSLPNSKVIKFAIEFADTEATLGEIERARGIMKCAAQLLPPGRNALLWESWDEFEVRYGDRESYKEMLKLKRRLEKEMRIETEIESQIEGNIAFVAASKPNAVNPEEIELDL